MRKITFFTGLPPQRTGLNVNSQSVLKDVTFGSQLEEAERSKLVRSIKEYIDIFACETNSPKRTTLTEHKIETLNEPVYMKPWEKDVDK